jgi:hypothetical protein
VERLVGSGAAFVMLRLHGGHVLLRPTACLVVAFLTRCLVRPVVVLVGALTLGWATAVARSVARSIATVVVVLLRTWWLLRQGATSRANGQSQGNA